MSHRARCIAALVGLCGLALGCASTYDLTAYPADQRTVFLQNFTNNSFQPDVNLELTEAVRGELARRGNLILADSRESSRFRLHGRIVLFRKEGRLFDNLRQPIRSELVLVCRVRIQGNDGAVFVREAAGSVEHSVALGFRESESQARRRLTRLVARRISSALERWYLSTYPLPKGPSGTTPAAPE